MQKDSVSSEGIELNVQFQKAIDLMSDPQQSVFITGKAGTGKSTLLDYFCKQSNNKPVILAPTCMDYDKFDEGHVFLPFHYGTLIFNSKF